MSLLLTLAEYAQAFFISVLAAAFYGAVKTPFRRLLSRISKRYKERREEKEQSRRNAVAITGSDPTLLLLQAVRTAMFALATMIWLVAVIHTSHRLAGWRIEYETAAAPAKEMIATQVLWELASYVILSGVTLFGVVTTVKDVKFLKDSAKDYETGVGFDYIAQRAQASRDKRRLHDKNGDPAVSRSRNINPGDPD